MIISFVKIKKNNVEYDLSSSKKQEKTWNNIKNSFLLFHSLLNKNWIKILFMETIKKNLILGNTSQPWSSNNSSRRRNWARISLRRTKNPRKNFSTTIKRKKETQSRQKKENIHERIGELNSNQALMYSAEEARIHVSIEVLKRKNEALVKEEALLQRKRANRDVSKMKTWSHSLHNDINKT